MNPPQVVLLTDAMHANNIRNLIKDLSAAVNEAQKAGLQVQLILAGMGTSAWVGYADAAVIIRKY